MWRSVASNALNLLIVAVLAVIGLISWGMQKYQAEGPLTQATFFEVPRGGNMRAVAADLEQAGIVSSASLFRIGADYSGQAGKLKFGNYQIPAGASMAQVLDIVTKGGASQFRYIANYVLRLDATGEMRLVERDPSTGDLTEVARFGSGDDLPEPYLALLRSREPISYRVTLPEGLTSYMVVEALKGADFLEGEVGDLPGEGALAPDQYEVARGSDRNDLLSRMQTAQAAILAEAWENRAEDVPLDTPEQALILASIVEKETGVPEERRQVSSVFTNRLKRGMRLQTDPTVIYGVTEGKGVLGRGLRQSELKRETPWNTYVINGLPPTPIANPGKAAIEAALNPDSTEYLFFVADGTGGHAFATNLREHNINVRKWRQIEAQGN
jgi:UPF0755 protein